MDVATKQYLKNSEWAHKRLQGSEKHHKMHALWSSDCPGILVLHFPHYLEDAAIPQVQFEAGAKSPHPRNACNTSGFMFLQSLTLLSRALVLGMYPRWLNILEFFFAKSSPQIRHCILPSPKSTYQGVQLLARVLVIVI
jgi:hypothetical protein